ncbi:DSC E3 ubiquitin ligase complex subunit 3 [Erysiphe neolycopersici]|uniref:DSC E3 ubiquitin ligase complex subunit 3 n=1 Tax=Erysiphe neolycopersici TaxID=212602 RepID=A0A420HZP8_9PEZI|nr:DSC E3 ubiquitin ligase complex subunit 3 [Erysiphe neolycopersici]
MKLSPDVGMLQTGPTQETLYLTVRFTNSFDLLLDIAEPNHTTILALKHTVRQKLDAPLAQHRFRFIFSGKLLKDDDILSEVLKLPHSYSHSHSHPHTQTTDHSRKGKAVEILPQRTFINCSIGDVLTSAELSAEADAATLSLNRSRERIQTQTGSGENFDLRKTTTTSPRGFDRLLSTGFSPAEVNQLRLQFRSIQQSIHTPDTMPSPSTLLRMEDAWIDDNSGNGAGSSGFDFGDDGLGGGAIDDILWGNIIGFFWPLGCIGFLMRESGVWSRRRKVAIFTGFILNMAFGILKVMS